MMVQKDKINEKIDKMVKCFEKYIGRMKDKLKISELLNSFQEKTKEDLFELIKLSNSRYKGVKTGNLIENILSEQMPKYKQIIDSTLKDDFYLTNEIHDEKKKFKKMNNKIYNSEIDKLRSQIKENSKLLNSQENSNKLYEAAGEKYKNENFKFFEHLNAIKSPIMEGINKTQNRKLNRTWTIANSTKDRKNGKEGVNNKNNDTYNLPNSDNFDHNVIFQKCKSI